jgi:hypothetical protein
VPGDLVDSCVWDFLLIFFLRPCAWLQNALLEFVRVVEAKEQVVAGTLHHLTLEAIEAGRKKVYEAKVWVKPWLDFKELQEFVHKGDATTFTNADLGAKKGSRSRPCDVAICWQYLSASCSLTASRVQGLGLGCL